MHPMNPFVTLRERALRSISDLKVYDDLVKRSRSMPTKPDAKLKVIGAGQPRTGTLSMYTAMLELGFKVRMLLCAE